MNACLTAQTDLIVRQQVAVLDQMNEAGVRAVALRAAGLPAETLDAMAVLLDQMRKIQGLPPVGK